MTEPGTTAQDTLRDDILASGRDDWVRFEQAVGEIADTEPGTSSKPCSNLLHL